ncbi:MAG: NADH-quinone oxidoreductase subunit M [Sphingobacteriales bacterium]|nr:MAG: NADH-quinone oxidoreductase subunit M [Sphingobacteriales bacterium]
MIVLLLFLVPLIGGLVSFALKDAKLARGWALLVSFATMALSLKGFADLQSGNASTFTAPWLGSLGSSFSLALDGLSGILTLLTGIAYPIILLATWKSNYRKAANFFGLLLLTQAGLMGVFTATDALLFYFFWELALVPVYFLCSGWGNERRIPVTFKFFIYTFTGSVIMLIALMYLYAQTPDSSFSMESFYSLHLSNANQSLIFGMLFIAFAVKMPIFPFHTWQPDTYEQSPTAVTMVLSGLMVKMGVFGLLRWVLPVVPNAVYIWGDVVMSLCVIGIIYASLLALQQDDLKRLVAYSSIAHIGLMGAAIFAETRTGLQGVVIQLFHHGINIIGLWIVVELIERQFGTRKLSELGGIAQRAPVLTIMLVIVAFANVSLPLTNSFAGEFLMFNGIWSSGGTEYNVVFTVLACISIILGAAYTLRMVQQVFFGATNERTEAGYRMRPAESVAMVLVVGLILWFGFYPQPLINGTEAFVTGLIKLANYSNLVAR